MTYSTPELAEALGAVGRRAVGSMTVRLHRWADAGLLTPSVDDGGPKSAGGHRRPLRWSGGDLRAVRALLLLDVLDVHHRGLWAAVASSLAAWGDAPPPRAWAVLTAEGPAVVDSDGLLDALLDRAAMLVVDLTPALRAEAAEDDDLVGSAF